VVQVQERQDPDRGQQHHRGGIISPAAKPARTIRRNRADRRVSQKLNAAPSGMISSTETIT